MGRRRTAPAAQGQLLRWALRAVDRLDGLPDAPGPIDDGALAGFAHLAEFHGAAPAAFLVLDRVPGAGPVTLGRLAAAYHRAVLRRLVTVDDLALVRRSLEGAGMPWLVMKGPVLAETMYRRPDVRPYEDLDVVVPAADLGRAIEALEAAGGTVVERNWDLVAARVHGQVHLLLPSGTYLDLHWHLVNDRRARAAFPIAMPEVFGRARPVVVAGEPVSTLSPADTLVHLALHASWSGGARLIWAKDLEQVVTRGEADWEDVAAIARRWRATLVLATQLRRARRQFGFPLPAEALALSPRSPWPRLALWTDRLSPPERSSGAASLARLVTRSTRGTTPASLGELARRTWAGARNGPDARGAGVADWDPASPRSLLHDAGGAGSRAAFLEAVAREDGAPNRSKRRRAASTGSP